jgi:hypothetical protein
MFTRRVVILEVMALPSQANLPIPIRDEFACSPLLYPVNVLFV